jgi:hypothetical protein
MKLGVAIVIVVFGFCAAGQIASKPATKPLERQVHGQTLTSKTNPAVEITFDKAFKYVGGQRWDLYSVADAEQHLFVKPGKNATVERLYWVQFEQYLPNNQHTYNYPPDRTRDIGGLEFIYDTRAYTDYSGLNREPTSDGAYAQALLKKHGYKFPQAAVRTRMIHLQTPDKRSELMIIYAESMDTKDLLKGAEDGALLDQQSPEVAQKVLQNALSGMKVRRR